MSIPRTILALTVLVLLTTGGLGMYASYHGYRHFEESRSRELARNLHSVMRSNLDGIIGSLDYHLDRLPAEATLDQWEEAIVHAEVKAFHRRGEINDEVALKQVVAGRTYMSGERAYEADLVYRPDTMVPLLRIMPLFEASIAAFYLDVESLVDFSLHEEVNIIYYDLSTNGFVALYPTQLSPGRQSEVLTMREMARLSFETHDIGQDVFEFGQSLYARVPLSDQVGLLIGRPLHPWGEAVMAALNRSHGWLFFAVSGVGLLAFMAIWVRYGFVVPLQRVAEALIHEEEATVNLRKSRTWLVPPEVRRVTALSLEMIKRVNGRNISKGDSESRHPEVDCYNRGYMKRLVLERSRRCTPEKPGAVVCVHLDALSESAFDGTRVQQKTVLNLICAAIEKELDRHGHGAGRALNYTLGYRDGGVFLIWLEGYRDIDYLLHVLAQAVHYQPLPYPFSRKRVRVIAVEVPHDTQVPDDLMEILRFMGLATRQVGVTAGNPVYLYDEAWRKRFTANRVLSESASHGYLDGEVRVLYTPLVEPATGIARGIVARIVWQHDRLGVVDPLDVQVDGWLQHDGDMSLFRRGFDMILRDLEAVRRSGYKDLLVGVPVSHRMLESERFISYVKQHGASDTAGPLALEVAHRNLSTAHCDTIGELERLNIGIALSEYGAGCDVNRSVVRPAYVRYRSDMYHGIVSSMHAAQRQIRADGGVIVNELSSTMPVSSVLASEADWLVDEDHRDMGYSSMLSQLQKGSQGNVVYHSFGKPSE